MTYSWSMLASPVALAFLLTIAEAPCRVMAAEEIHPPPGTNQFHVAISTSEGSRLKGQFLKTNLGLKSPSVGVIQVPITQIRSIQKEGSNIVFQTQNGDRLAGEMTDACLVINTCLGEIQVPVDLLVAMTVFPPGQTWDLNTGLVARWSAEGDAKDSVGAHHGDMMFGAKFAEGVQGKAFSFDGVRSKISIPDHPAFKPTNSFTIEGWLAVPPRMPHGASATLFNRGDNRGGLDSYMVSIQNDGTLGFTIWDPINKVAQIFTPVPKNQWLHFAAVFRMDAGLMQLFVNGEKTAETETTLRPILELDPQHDPAVGIGNHGGRMHQFPSQSLIDELGYYSRALNPEEIRARFRAGEPEKQRARPRFTNTTGFDEL